MADSLLAALVYGVPARERGGAQIQLPATGQELNDVLTRIGWKFTLEASQFADSRIRVFKLGETTILHVGKDGEPHSDRLEILSTLEGTDKLIVACKERENSTINGLVIATRKRMRVG